MLVLGEGGALIELVLLVYCVLNIITTPEPQVRNLPKPLWLLLVIVLPLVGGIAWLVAGRPQRGQPGRLGEPGRLGRRRGRGLSGWAPQYNPPGRAPRPPPDDDEAFLSQLRRRAEEQRRRGQSDPKN